MSFNDEEEQERWWEERRLLIQAHRATLDAETLRLAAACVQRVRDATQHHPSISDLRVPLDEFNAFEASLLPIQRYSERALLDAGINNLLCQGVPIIPEVPE